MLPEVYVFWIFSNGKDSLAFITEPLLDISCFRFESIYFVQLFFIEILNIAYQDSHRLGIFPSLCHQRNYAFTSFPYLRCVFPVAGSIITVWPLFHRGRHYSISLISDLCFVNYLLSWYMLHFGKRNTHLWPSNLAFHECGCAQFSIKNPCYKNFLCISFRKLCVCASEKERERESTCTLTRTRKLTHTHARAHTHTHAKYARMFRLYSSLPFHYFLFKENANLLKGMTIVFLTFFYILWMYSTSKLFLNKLHGGIIPDGMSI